MDQKARERVSAEETARFIGSHGFNRVDDAGLAGINKLKDLLCGLISAAQCSRIVRVACRGTCLIHQRSDWLC